MRLVLWHVLMLRWPEGVLPDVGWRLVHVLRRTRSAAAACATAAGASTAATVATAARLTRFSAVCAKESASPEKASVHSGGAAKYSGGPTK